MYGNPTGRKAYRIGGYKMSETGYRFGGTAVGESLGRIYGYKIDHIIQTEAEADAAYYDALSKGHRVSDGQQIPAARTPVTTSGATATVRRAMPTAMKSSMPRTCSTWATSCRTRRAVQQHVPLQAATLSIYLDYALGHSIYNYMKTRMIQNTIGQSNSAIASYVYDCWKYRATRMRNTPAISPTTAITAMPTGAAPPTSTSRRPITSVCATCRSTTTCRNGGCASCT